MDLEIHPSAKVNFNEKAQALISLIRECPRENAEEQSFSPDFHIAASFTDEDIIGEVLESQTDYKDRTISLFFSHNKKRYGLIEEDYEKLTTLASSIQRVDALRTKLSFKFVSGTIFDWVKARFKQEDVDLLFVPFLLRRAEENVKRIRIIIPINNFVVESPFKFGGSTIANLNRTDFDIWEKEQIDSNPEFKADVGKLFEKCRKDFQGYASVITDFDSEINFARKVGLQQAIRVTELLGIYSEAMFLPDIKCSSRVKGMEMDDSYTIFAIGENVGWRKISGALNTALATTRFMSKEKLGEYTSIGLGRLSYLANAKAITEFESSILTFAFLYSKAAFTSDPMEKVVYMLSALESTLLKNENEPIQQNLAERIAFFSTEGLDERKKIIKNIKRIYNLRSKYLHHGITQSESSILLEFLQIVWVFFSCLLTRTERFGGKEEFLQYIDDLKLS